MKNRQRDIGLSSAHGINGKGDAPRYDMNSNWCQNYDEIDWQRSVLGIFHATGYRKFRKVYPAPRWTDAQVAQFGAALAVADRGTDRSICQPCGGTGNVYVGEKLDWCRSCNGKGHLSADDLNYAHGKTLC